MALVVHPHFHPRRTGVTRHVETIVPALAKELDARTIGYGIARDLPRIGWAELLRRAGSEEIVWHAHRNNELLAALLLRVLRPKLKVVFTRHSTKPPGRYTRFLARRADAVIALTAEVQQAFALPSQIVAHGVDLTRFRPPEDRSRAWAELGVGGTRGVGVIGRIRPEKGQGDFAEALAPLFARFTEWKAIAVGAVKAEDARFAQSVRERGVTLIAEQDDIPRWYRGLTIFVHPSHREAFSMALLEAMAAGCCVVAAKLPAMAEVIRDRQTGFLFPPGDVAALRSILEELMADPARAEQIGAAAAEDVRRRFGVEHEANALLRTYRAAWGVR
jgi:mannosyltransferase